MLGEFGNGYWVALARLVTNRNRTLEAFVAGPLNGEQGQRATLIPPRETTHDNADICYPLVLECSELFRAVKIMALTRSRSFQGNTKAPIHTSEENWKLQHHLLGNAVRGPHCLGNHSASVRDNAVKKQIV
jgi:hypothetical protein